MASVQYPIHGQTDVYINKPLVYIFNKPVKEASLFTGSVVLFDAKDHHVVDGIISYDPASFAVQFLPSQELTKGTSYTFSFAGQDDDTILPIEFEDNTKLAQSIWIDFQTGQKRWGEQTYTAGSANPYDRIIADGQTLEEYTADTFKVLSTTPIHMGTFINVLTDTITIKFSKPLKTGQNWASLISMSYSPVYRETFYFNSDSFKDMVADRIPGHTELINRADKFMMPTGTWALVAADTLQWTKTLGQPNFNANAFVNIVLSEHILSSTDDQLNGKQDEHMYFMTQLFPVYTNPETILLRLANVANTVSEDVILKYILINSITAFNLANIRDLTELVHPNRYAQAFVECATVIAIIDGKLLNRQLNSGKAITLGDLQLTYGAIDTNLSLPQLRTEAAKCMDEAKNALLFISGNRDFWVGERGMGKFPSVYGIYRNQIPHSYANVPGYTGYNQATAQAGYLGVTGYLGRGGILSGGVFI